MTLHLSHIYNEKCEFKKCVIVMSKYKLKNKTPSNEKFKSKTHYPIHEILI
jgi:hypothetical protein